MIAVFYFKSFSLLCMSVENGISFDAEQFIKKSEESEEGILEELVSGSEAQIKDRLNIWREIIQKHSEEHTLLEGQIGPDIPFVLIDKEGNSVNMTERLLCHEGNSYQLEIFSQGRKVGFLSYQSGSDTSPISMGKTEINSDFQKLGLNALLFQHMTFLHPDASEVYSKMDGDNFDAYFEALKIGKTPVEAINNTPAGRVRARAGWVLDLENSKLPVLTPGEGISRVRVVYKRKDL